VAITAVPCVASFDDAWAANGQGSDPSPYYSAFGVTFDNSDGYGVIGGEGNNDPGNWNIEGSNGPAAWGIWSGTHSIFFTSPTAAVSVDFLRGHSDTSFTVYGHQVGGGQLTQTISLSGAYDVETAVFSGLVEEISWTNSGTHGVDNIQYESSSTCPP